MLKAVLLFTLVSLISISHCEDSSLEFLSVKELHADINYRDFLIGFFNGSQIFKDITFPESCDINNDQSKALIQDILKIMKLMHRFKKNWYHTLPKLRERFVDVFRILKEVDPGCHDAWPAVKERFHQILSRVGTLEYHVKWFVRFVMKFEKFQEEASDALNNCWKGKGQEIDAKVCGEKVGLVIHDVFLWDCKKEELIK
jgi:hypothetical protein